MQDPVHAPLPARLGDFDVLALLGAGGSGVVYRARWGHREIALKVLQPDLELTQRERERFFAEAQRLSSIQHPSVVKVMGVGALPDGRPYLAMELITGETLANRLARGPLTIGHSLELFRQLAGAVEALHAQGLVHRDLKPENVMLIDDETHVVLLDFGIAKELDAPDSTVTQEGSVRGSPAYMAPERFFGRPAGRESDIYELAVILYIMLAGRLPWDRHDDPAGRLGVPPLSSHGIQVPAEIETCLLQALSTRAEARPQSAAEFARLVGAGDAKAAPGKRMTADLRAPRATASSHATGPAASPSGPPHHVHPGSNIASPTGGQMARLPVAHTPVAYAPTQHASQTPSLPAKGPSRRRPLLLAGAVVLVAAGIATVLLVTRGGTDSKTAQGELTPETERAAHTDEQAPASAPTPTSPEWPLADEAATNAFAHAPRDTHFLAVVRFGALRRHKHFGPLIAELRKHPQYNLVSTFTKSCDADPIDDISWFSMGVSAEDNEPADLTLQTRLSRDDLEACLTSYLGKLDRDGPLTLGPDGDPLFGWLGENTVVASTRDADKKWFKERVAGEKGVSTESFGGLLELVDRSASVYFAGAGALAWKGGVGLDIEAPRFIAGHVDAGGDLSAKIFLLYDDEARAAKAATTLADEIKKAKDENGSFLDSLRSGQEGPRVTIEAKIEGMFVGMIAGLIRTAI